MKSRASVENYIRAVPKAELHVHLAATIQPATLFTLSAHHGIELPARTVEDLKQWFVFRDFAHFRSIYRLCASCLVSAEDFELVVYEYGRELARQNGRYAEVAFAPANPYLRGVPEQAYMNGLARGRSRVKEDFGVEINWIFELGRGPESPKTWDHATHLAIEGKAMGVVALGLSGPETARTTASFSPWFDRARAEGLHSAPHAGELMGPANIWSALQHLGAERIGHGVRAIEDPRLVSLLADRGTPLEICPRSNICLGVYERLEEHPLPRLNESEVTITVNSDDPSLFTTTLTDELLTLVEPFNLELDAVDEIVLNAVRHSFLPLERRKELEGAFLIEMAALKDVHLGMHDAELRHARTPL